MSGTLQRLAQLGEAFAQRGLDVEAHRAGLELFRNYLLRYAWLEKKLLGGVRFPAPLHLLERGLPEDPLQAAEVLAERERERLGVTGVEIGDVMSLLDRDEIKVYRVLLPEASPLLGFFLYDPDAGPALATARGLPDRESDALFARLYGHALFDHDPYEIRLVLAADHGGPEGLRALAFAAAFLIDRGDLEAYLTAAGVPAGARLPNDLLGQLAVYFEVSLETLLARLLALGRVEPAQIQGLLEAPPPPSEPQLPLESNLLGERFTRLALEAHARQIIDLPVLASYLETTTAQARRVAGRFRLPSPP